MLWILISIGLLIVVLAILAFYLNKNEKVTPNYYSLFIMGIIFLMVGILLELISYECSMNYIFMSLGVIYAFVGFIHRKKWRKNCIPWKKLSRKEKELRSLLIIVLSIIVLAGLTAYLFVL